MARNYKKNRARGTRKSHYNVKPRAYSYEGYKLPDTKITAKSGKTYYLSGQKLIAETYKINKEQLDNYFNNLTKQTKEAYGSSEAFFKMQAEFYTSYNKNTRAGLKQVIFDVYAEPVRRFQQNLVKAIINAGLEHQLCEILKINSIKELDSTKLEYLGDSTYRYIMKDTDENGNERDTIIYFIVKNSPIRIEVI